MVKRALSVMLALTLIPGVLFAQPRPKVAHTTHSGPIVPAKASPAALKTIFTNLGPSATDDYNDTTGYYVLGPTNSVGDSEQWIGLPFIPAANSHVTQLQAAIGSISGTSVVTLALYTDNAGVAGTQLASGLSTHIPLFGACCQLVAVTIPSTVVKAGTQYWIVATSDDTKGPDFTGVWQASNSGTISYNEALGGWAAFSTNTPAGAAKGTIP